MWEWCADWYDKHYYEACPKKSVIENPSGPDTGGDRVIRGGSCIYQSLGCRPTLRHRIHPDIEVDYEELFGYERASKDDYFIGKLGKEFSVARDFLAKFSVKGNRIESQAGFRPKVTLGVPGVVAIESEIPWNLKKIGRWFQQILQKI